MKKRKRGQDGQLCVLVWSLWLLSIFLLRCWWKSQCGLRTDLALVSHLDISAAQQTNKNEGNTLYLLYPAVLHVTQCTCVHLYCPQKYASALRLGGVCCGCCINSGAGSVDFVTANFFQLAICCVHSHEIDKTASRHPKFRKSDIHFMTGDLG